jgi:hypothetical protein
MPTQIRWIASLSSSSLHAADAIRRGWELVEPQLSTAIRPAAIDLADEIRSSGLPQERLWGYLNALAHQIENNRELAATALRKTVGGTANETLTSRLTGRIAAIENAVQSAAPRLVDDLTHRTRPIREQWEAYGPGLLSCLGRDTDPQLIVENAEVVLVYPFLGGGGAAHLLNNSARLEAVLTNHVPELPEVLRLAWLLGQLHHDLPRFTEHVPADRVAELAQWAMIPATLAAAQQLELTAYSDATLRSAVSNWLRSDSATLPNTLALWWQTYVETRPSWSIALQALDRMMDDGRTRYLELGT